MHQVIFITDNYLHYHFQEIDTLSDSLLDRKESDLTALFCPAT